MDVDQAAQVRLLEEPGERPGFGGLDLASAFPQLRLDVGEAQGRVDLRLARARQRRSRAPASEEAVFVQLQIHPLRAAPQLRVVLLRSREGEERRGNSRAGDDAQVGGEAVARIGRKSSSGLPPMTSATPGSTRKASARRRRVGGRGHEVDVADDLLAAAQAPRDLDR